MTVLFQYSSDLLAEFPDVCGGVLYASGLHNGLTQKALRDMYATEQGIVRDALPASLADVPSLAAWRVVFRRFGANPTKYRSAAEALLRRLQKRGDIPSINCLVGIGNLVSIRHALPVAIFEIRDLIGPISVHLAQGDERFRELGSDEIVHPPSGEVIFSDETGTVIARRRCWRQSLDSASRADTRTALVTVEAQHEDGRDAIQRALVDLAGLLESYAGASVQSSIVDASQPAFVTEDA